MRYLAFLFLVAFVALPVSAHVSGESFEWEMNGYLVDIGYSTDTPSTHDVVTFDMQLMKNEESAGFTDVWVLIQDAQGAAVFAGGLHNAAFGGVRLSYRFPEAGAYKMSVRYEQGDETLAEVSVPFSVHADASPHLAFAFVGGIAIALLVYLITRFIRRMQ